MRYSYVVYDANNHLRRGTVDAPTLREAVGLLVGQGWFVKKISPQGRLWHRWRFTAVGGVSLIDKVLFAKHLAVMMKSGITISEALTVIEQQSSAPRFKRIISKMNEKVRSGQNLSNACALFPRIFDPMFVNLIKVGEQSGTLEENLNRLASELEERLELRRAVRTASFYPAIVFSATFGLILILAYFVLPKIKGLFTALKFDLPLSTRILLAVADIFDRYGLIIFIGVALGFIALRIITVLPFFKPGWHRFILFLPLLGTITKHYNLVLINRTMGLLLHCGLTIDQSLIITANITSNEVFRAALRAVTPQVQKGMTVSASIDSYSRGRRALFPLLVVKMISVGEKSGKLDESFMYIADFYQREVKESFRSMTTVLEPLLLLIVGSIVGFVAVSVITPIYQVTAQFRR